MTNIFFKQNFERTGNVVVEIIMRLVTMQSIFLYSLKKINESIVAVTELYIYDFLRIEKA